MPATPALRKSNSRLSLLLLLTLLGMASSAIAGEFCVQAPSPFGVDEDGDGINDFGIVDGSEPATVQFILDNNVTQITIDGDCTFRNWPASSPLKVTINFQTSDPSVYLITFDNVVFAGNMACASIDHRIWFVNNDPNDVSVSCQDLFIPVESISKQVPAGKTTVGIGEVFTYTLTIPVLYDPSTGTVIDNAGSSNDLHSITVVEDLNQIAANLTLVGTPTVEWTAASSLSGSVTHNFTNNAGLLTFEILPADSNSVQVKAGDQFEIKVTVSVDDTNVIGTQFSNTARWSFGRVILLDPNDEDGDGNLEPTFFDPLPGENGVSEILTIGAANLAVTKSSPDSALNIGARGTFSIDVQNTGNADAWDFTIVDEIPGVADNPAAPLDAGMCQFDPSATVTAQIFQADGVTAVTPLLTAGSLPGADYSVSFNNAAPLPCELTLQFDSSGPNAAVLAPGYRLIIAYQSELDSAPPMDQDGALLTNVAGATQWYSADPGGTAPASVTNNTLTDGTPGDPTDHESSYTITAGLSGYFFTKSVQNLTTGASPANTAASGDRLRYQMRVFNVDQTIDTITIVDPDLISVNFDPASFSIFSSNAVSQTYDPITGSLSIDGGNISALNELVIEYEINLAAGLTNGTVVSNQAVMTATGTISPSTLSDDPNINGVDDPQTNPPNPDPTVITIRQPGPLLKSDGPSSVTIGDEITYRITVPAVPVAIPLYDVRILDDLVASGADLEFVNATVVSGGTWTLSNTGTGNNLVIEDTGAGIDIPLSGQAVVDITVRVANTVNNQIGVNFNNTATFTYNRTNNVPASQTQGSGDTTSTNTVITEPDLTTFTKTVDNTAPTAGSTVRYTLTLTAASGANNTDVFDLTLSDTLDPGLVYAGNPTVTTGGAGGNGAGDGNSIIDPDVTGDGITVPQLLVWSTVEADIDIDAGETISIAYDVLVLDTVLANQTLSNNVVAQWTGIDGVNSFERSGIDGAGGVLNDYATVPAIEILTTLDIVTTIDKIRSADTFNTGDDSVRIGDILEYSLTIPMPEGTLGNAQLLDTMPQGLDFIGVVSINGNTGPAPYAAVAPFSHSDIVAPLESGDPASGSSTVTWSLGDLSNPFNDGLSDDFVIVYQAQVLNNDVLLQADSTPLNNTVTLSYDTATTSVSASDTDTVINVMQPNVTVGKSASPANGDAFIDAGEVISYSVDLINTGAAPVYDVVLEDIIPSGLRGAGVTTTSITRHTTATDAQVAALAIIAPTFNAITGLASWNFDTAVADTYSIPIGETLRVTYSVSADVAIAQGLILTNAATATLYYSFDDEATPVGAAATDREIYGPSNTASTTLFTSAPPGKALITPTPGAAEVTIGEEIVYQITVPGVASASSLLDVSITDTLDPNLELVAVTVNGVIGTVDTSTASQMNLAIAQIPAGQQAAIELRTRLRNQLGAQQGVAIDNTVSYSYAFTAGGALQPLLISTDLVTVNIVEPNIGGLSKTANNLTPTAGETVRYSLQLAASGGIDASDVFGVTITDTLDSGLVYVGNPSVTGVGNTIGAPLISGDGITIPQTLVWSLVAGNADIDIVEGSVVTLEYDVRIDASLLAGQVLNNSVFAAWTGIDGVDGFERDGADGIGGLNDYVTAPVAVAINLPGINTTISKIRSNDTFGPADDQVRIGEIVEYSLTIPMPEGTLGNLQLVDTLPQGLDFEGIVSINGHTGPTVYTAIAPFSHADINTVDVIEVGDPAIGNTTVTWNIGTVTNLPVDDLPNDFVIVYRARAMDTVFAQALTSFTLNNLVTLSYDTAGGAVISSDVDTVISVGQPLITVSKSAAPAGGDSIIDAGELITYTVDVVNSGSAPAYDLVLEDILPVGLRNGTATVTMVSTGLLLSGALPNLVPTYDPATGFIVWNLDTGVADAYTIPPGDTLRLVYQAQAEIDLGPGLTLTNAVTTNQYYSFDDEAVPALGTVTGTSEIYGPSNTATITLTTAAPVALLKQTTQATAYIGEAFTYRITVPATPQTTALEDVRIIDDLAVSAADLSFVSVNKIAGTGSWTPVNTGDLTNLVIEDTVVGIDIPAGDQAVIEITVVLNNSPANVAGLVFNNVADYTWSATQTPGLPGTSGDMTIVEPDSLVLLKSGPVAMRVGVPGTFTLDIQNTGSGTAWDSTIVDLLPNPTPGGMCDAAPVILGAQVFAADGSTPVSGLLTEGVDFITAFSGEPDCQWTITLQSASAAIGASERLIINYEVFIDNDSIGGTDLTNIAAITEWFSGDTAGGGATGDIRAYSGILSTGTVGVNDEQDAHTLTTERPVLLFQKTVVNMTSGQNPGVDAQPGDRLQYSIHLENISGVNVTSFSIIDELDALNATALFVPGSLVVTSLLPVGADTTLTDPNGGTQGSGLIHISNLSLDAIGGVNDQLDVVFEAVLVPVIDAGTVVLNQASLDTFGITIASTDDPNVNGLDDPAISGDEDPTQTLINSAPLMVVQKTSVDITGDPAVLVAGDTLSYTLTIRNVGTENSFNTLLSDQIPANTTYVASSTTLNGVIVADPLAGESALASGMLINAPEITTAGFMRADVDPAANNVATITFDVITNPSLFDGAVISNQGFITGEGVGSGIFPQQPSDDPGTALADDPTLDVIGSSPLVDVVKTVTISVDNGSPGVVDPGDQLRYTITAINIGSIPATGVVLTDAVPTNTSYVADSVFLNGLPAGQPDGGVSPLVAGMDISSSDLTPPVPAAGNGVLSAGESAVVIFDVLVDALVASGTVIRNQGFVTNNELPVEPSDFDGIDSNGDQPTDVIVGAVQQLAITKDVFLVSGIASPGSELEYLIRVTNVGGIDATNVVITDNLDQPVAGQMTYVAGSGRLNGLTAGVSFATPILTGNYAAVYGVLPPGAVAELRFRVQLDPTLILGTTLTNTGQVDWSSPAFSATASVDIDVGGIPGTASLSGLVWSDDNFNDLPDAAESLLSGWRVELYRDNLLLNTVLSDINGAFQFTGLAPNLLSGGSGYELRYVAPGATATSATLGNAGSVFTNWPQRITNIFAASGSSLQNLNLPRQANGIVYDAIVRLPVAGAQLSMINQTRSNQPVPANCFEDPNHQNQITLAEGYYKFDLNFSDPTRCAEGDEYEIQVLPPTGYLGTTSIIIPPFNLVSGIAQDVPTCPGTGADRVPATTQHCENSSSALQPDPSIAPRTPGTDYYLKFLFNSVASTDQIYHNHIPVDPELADAVLISKQAERANVSRGQLVPYTITLNNSLNVPLYDLNVVDHFPAGFKYVSNSSSLDGVATEPLVNGRELTWSNIDVSANQTRVIKLLLVAGSGVSEGEYVNTAWAINAITNTAASGIASATVRIIPDPGFDCTDVIGKVFDDKNLNGYQDEGETGLAGVQVVTARGLRLTTDASGRFHITCALVANEIRGSNFIIKVDDRTLPSGYRITTENPRVQRATRGKMLKFNFGATIHRVVRLDLANGVFEPGAIDLRPQWVSRIDMLLAELEKAPSILRLSYLAENETESEVEDRLDSISDLLSERWQELNCCYRLSIEKEVFWRKGKPSSRLTFE